MAAATILEPPFSELQAALNKKATFESACSQLASQPDVLAAGSEGRALVARARTLLRSRFTGRPFWVAGRQLFRSAQAQAAGDDAFRRELELYIQECDEYLGDAAGPSEAAGPVAGAGSSGVTAADSATAALFASVPAPPAPGGFLFEGQLSGEGDGAAAPRPQPRLLDLLGGAFAQQLAAAQGQQGGDEGRADQSEQVSNQEPGSQQQQQQQQQPSLDAQQQAVELPPHVLEAIERELDAIAVQIMEETGQQAAQRAPPASKRVVASLPKEHLTAARLQQLGGAGTRCPVCMDEFSEGDEVQVMPCCHSFHPPCLAPWLQTNNSCPTCRHELPTDDQKYENRKERERVEEEDRRGAANAVSHNDFLYI